MPNIVCGLSEKELTRAIKEVKQYQRELEAKVKLLVQVLTDTGVEIAKVKVSQMGAVFTGELQASIQGYYSPTYKTGVIYVGSWWGVYVEYGTGIVGKQNPHPDPEGWLYDINDHGEEGWNWWNSRTGTGGHTTGMESRPFMFETARELEAKMGEIAREVFR